MYKLFTDGSVYPNPGNGGWAFILRDTTSGNETRGKGAERGTTNNRMELTAVIEGIKSLPEGTRVRLYSDSQYVIYGITKWRKSWRKAKWAGVKNADLWQVLDGRLAVIKLEPIWIRGHDGHEENEECDRLAGEARCGV
jgi:ribonuclease HI